MHLCISGRAQVGIGVGHLSRRKQDFYSLRSVTAAEMSLLLSAPLCACGRHRTTRARLFSRHTAWHRSSNCRRTATFRPDRQLTNMKTSTMHIPKASLDGQPGLAEPDPEDGLLNKPQGLLIGAHFQYIECHGSKHPHPLLLTGSTGGTEDQAALRRARLALYGSHTLATWGQRSWEFAVGK